MTPNYGEALTSRSASHGRADLSDVRTTLAPCTSSRRTTGRTRRSRCSNRGHRTARGVAGPSRLRAEERVLAVLPTDPVSVLTEIGYADANGNATFGRYTSLDLLDATTLALIAEIPRSKDPRLNWTLDDTTSEDIELALEELWFLRDPFLRFGHTSLAAARILLQSRGVCAGCEKNIGLRGLAARGRVHIHTVDPPPRGSEPADWPATLCTQCRGKMGDNFLEFRFARHPQCPKCHARRTRKTTYGMRATPNVLPWEHARGCCVSEEKWTCSKCRHTW